MSTPLMVPQLRSCTQPFTGTDSIHILGTSHQLGPVTLSTLIVQVYELPETGPPSVLMPPSSYEYVLDEGTGDVLVMLRQPTTGSVLLTTFGPAMPMPDPATLPLGAVPPVPAEAPGDLTVQSDMPPTEEVQG